MKHHLFGPVRPAGQGCPPDGQFLADNAHDHARELLAEIGKFQIHGVNSEALTLQAFDQMRANEPTAAAYQRRFHVNLFAANHATG
jgi:hypothetical protein